MEYFGRPVVAKQSQTEKGIRFNVETVKDLGEPLRLRNDTPNTLKYTASKFYEKEFNSNGIEVSSFAEENVVHPAGSLICTILRAFADHFPLILKPDDFWCLITFAFARHVDENSEKLRSNFVDHSGKKNLVVNVDHFVMGEMQPKDWERDVFPDFTKQIGKHVKGDIHKVITSGFSTTSPTTKAAFEITLMSAMKHYFTYTMRTCCGIPWIELEGTKDDWILLREKTQKLFTSMVPEFRDVWKKSLIPVLNEFVNVYDGKVNHHFWQSMVKRVPHGHGSGSYSTISGWINIFYPYLAKKMNNFVIPWEELRNQDGNELGDYPLLLSSAPVNWEYYGKNYDMHIHAGMLGTLQDPDTLALRPRIGWFVTHVPQEKVKDEDEEKIEELEKELKELNNIPDANITARTNYRKYEVIDKIKTIKYSKKIKYY